MISNQERSLKDLSHALAEGAIRNPTISQHRHEVPLINQHAFDNQDIINVQAHVREIGAPAIQQEVRHQGSLNVSRHVQDDLRVEQNSFAQGQHHDPLFYGANAPQPAAVANPVLAQPQPYFDQRGINGHGSNFRVYQNIPWWVLLIIFVVCLAAFGGVIAWMFQRRKSIAKVSTVTTTTATTPAQTIPVMKQRKVISVDQLGNIVENTETTTLKNQVSTTNIAQQPVSTPASTLAPVAPSAQTIVQSKTVQQPKATVAAPGAVTPIIEPKGLICPDGSFSFNNRCYSCPAGQRWNGSNCISALKHLKRS